MNVRYKAIAGFRGYRVGSDGSVWTKWIHGERSKTTGMVTPGRIGKAWKRMSTKGSYPQVTLIGNDGSRKQMRVHVLVLEAFVGPRPHGMECCHFPDRNPANCSLNNLRWDTRSANRRDAMIHGTFVHGELSKQARLTATDVAKIREERVATGATHASLGRKYGVGRRAIGKILDGTAWKRT